MGIVEKRVEEELKGKLEKKKDAATSSIYLIPIIAVFHNFCVKWLCSCFINNAFVISNSQKKFYKVFGYLLILNLLVTLFFKK